MDQSTQRTAVVTGAFGLSGRAISQSFIRQGWRVRTLTSKPPRGPGAELIEVHRLDFSDHKGLIEALRAADVFVNTYWVRYNTRDFTFAGAVENSKRLFEAAGTANVGRVIHLSITNPSLNSPFEYFRGKAEVEATLAASGLPYSILRPALIYGEGDILINNIAWAVRHLPVYIMLGDGSYQVQPIHADDLAGLAVKHASINGNAVVDAIGPETFTFRKLVTTIQRSVGRRQPIMNTPARAAFAASRLYGWWLGDIVLTWEEVGALMAGLLSVDSPPTGSTALSDWLVRNADWIGRRYANDLAKRKKLA